jgi:hypothetical protein
MAAAALKWGFVNEEGSVVQPVLTEEADSSEEEEQVEVAGAGSTDASAQALDTIGNPIKANDVVGFSCRNTVVMGFVLGASPHKVSVQPLHLASGKRWVKSGHRRSFHPQRLLVTRLPPDYTVTL